MASPIRASASGEAGSQPTGYPRLLRRLQGAFIDGIVIPLAILGTLVALAYARVESTWVRVTIPILVALLLEPIAVSMTGGSIGHHLIGLRVRKERADERIGIAAALVRFVVKTLFGLPAFYVAFVTRKRQALHDLAARSLIVHRKPTQLPAHEIMQERTLRDEHATYASWWRRLLVVLLYWVLLYVTWNLALFAILAGPCLTYGRCTQVQIIVAQIGLGLLLIFALIIAVLGWRGRLYGGRRSRENGALRNNKQL